MPGERFHLPNKVIMYQYWGWLVPSLSNSQMCTYILLLSKLTLFVCGLISVRKLI